jgi:phosphoserine phosphatase RsbU/P
VLIVTSRELTEDLVAALDAGADDYVTKPFQVEELKARVGVGLRVASLQRRLADRVAELEHALAHVTRLQGLLPICMYCKKIRNDQNYWTQVETYITDHSEVRFSHGICPECRAKHIEPELERIRKAGALRATQIPSP